MEAYFKRVPKWVFPTLLVCLSILYYWPLLDYLQWNLEDEGDLVYPALRVLKGEVIYRDFELGTSPGTILLLAGYFKLFGATLASARVFIILVTVANQLMLYAIAKRLLAPRFAFLAGLLFGLTSLAGWPITSYHWLALSGLLATVLACQEMISKPQSRALPLLAGSLAAFTCYLLQTTGLVAVLSCLGAAIVQALRSDLRTALKQLGLGVLGALLLGLPILVWMLNLVGSELLLTNLFLRHLSSQQGRLGFQHTEFIFFPWKTVSSGMQVLGELPFSQLWLQKMRVLDFLTWPSLYFISHSLFYPLAVLFVLVGVYKFARDRSSETRQQFLFLALVTVLHSLTALYRPDATHISFTRHLWWILVVFALAWLVRSSRTALRYGGLVLICLVLAVTLVSSGFKRGQWTPSQSFLVRFPNGVVRVKNVQQARNLNAFAQFLKDRGQGRPRMFVYPIFPMLYFLADGVNPTPFDRMIPVWSSAKDWEVALESVQTADFIVLLQFNYDAYLRSYPSVDREQFIADDQEFRKKLWETGKTLVQLWPQFGVLPADEERGQSPRTE